MKALLLARVSSKEQEEGQSIPAQERRLREYADRKGFIVDQVLKSLSHPPKIHARNLKRFLRSFENPKKP